jgi:NADH dehydrogenase [ubiquinone] 1 alpha subcomplex assembly factor 1
MLLEPDNVHWRIINDGVMGGRSSSDFTIDDSCLSFHGELSTENNGGFVSLLGRLEKPVKGMAGFSLVVSGDGRRYQLRLRESDASGDFAWRALFACSNQQTKVIFETADFEPVMRGKPVIGATALEHTNIHYLGFMLTSRHPGPFRLNVHAIEIV